MARPSGGFQESVAHETRLRLVASRGAVGTPPVLVLSGEFDLDTVPHIDRFLRRHLGPLYHQDHLVIDLAATTFVDSSFIAFVVRLLTDQRARRKELVLVQPTGQVRRVLALVGLPNVVPVFESVDEAVARLVSGRLPVIPPAFNSARA
ncbi:MAG: STAS domain-containing protein [Actinobacteria bacterium]|nr:STAS domain-containing protein [Actinomycetota bacterium]